MENLQKVERSLMSQEEFEKYIFDNSGLKTFDGVRKFKSVFRAIKRGHMIKNGMINPKRPFNNRANSSNRKNTHSRVENELKKEIYEQYKQYQRRTL